MRRTPWFRSWFGDGSFRVVTNFFTSFGYFQDAEDGPRTFGDHRGAPRGPGAPRFIVMGRAI